MNSPKIGAKHPNYGKYAPLEQSGWGKATYPLGAHSASQNVTFAVYSRNATHILLEIYHSPTQETAQYDYWLQKNPQDHIWRAKIAAVPLGTFYGFRCWGPNWKYEEGWQRGNSNRGFQQDVDDQGNRFNPNKVLYDPYAREISHDKETPAMLAAGENEAMYFTGGGQYRGIICREYDTGKWAPKGIVVASDKTSTGTRPHLEPQDAAIYETHIRGLTQHKSSSQLQQILQGKEGFEAVENVPEAYRGTYAGAAYMAKYLQALGFTTIELLPVQETANDTNPDDSPGGNYWGYMTFGYFAPDRRYAYDKSPGGPTREFKQMVKAFHDQGLEVYLDVVYNHTGEGGNVGHKDVTAFVSFGGFDASEYYVLTDDYRLVDGATGCGNQLNFSHQVTQNLVVDSLSYWLEEMGIDGFRFDLAPVLGRTPSAFARENWKEQRQFFPQHPLLKRIQLLGEKYDAEIIAEAWDIWGYEVGNFPAGWAEWNGRYRDSVRRFLKGDGNTNNFCQQVNGDYESFNDQGGPQKSINFVVAHDGFTLMDLVSYNHKNNDNTWPFGPSDGGNDNNDSWDSGGDRTLRRQRLRNFWTILFFSRGVPMVLWGDEFGRTQNGNNNAYNIDSVATWNNYHMIGTNSPTAIATEYSGAYHDNFGTATNNKGVNPLFLFVNYLAHLRKNHLALRQHQYADLVMDSGNDVTYQFRKTDGYTALESSDRCVWLRIDGSEVEDHDFLVLINMYSEPVTFLVPSQDSAQDTPRKQWVLLIDTAAWAEPNCNFWKVEEASTIIDNYQVNPFAIVVLEEITSGGMQN
jgi:glycogen operon protein